MNFNIEAVSAFGFMGALLLLGVVARARFGFLQRALIPASLLGGLAGFVLMTSGLTFGFSPGQFTVFAFHLFTISFMSLCLTGSDQESASSEPKASLFGGSTWMAVVWTLCFALQALIGLAVVLAWNGVLGDMISPYLGLIVAQGFTQGPGQALAIGDLWEQGFGITDAVQVGVIFASIGFLVCFLVGVPVARWILKGDATAIDQDVLSGVMGEDQRPVATRHVTHPGNVETLAYHLGLLGLAYILTWHYMLFMRDLVAGLSLGTLPLPILFSDSLFFVHGLLISLLMRLIIDRAGWARFLDTGTQKAITGVSVDFMIVATLMGIQFAVLTAYLPLIVLVSLAVTLISLAVCFAFTDRDDPNGLRRSLTIFGCCCGSAGTGLLLLRLVDPHFETPIAHELALYNVILMVVAAPLTIFMAPTLPAFGLMTVGLVYGAAVLGGLVYLALARRHRRMRRA